MTITVMNLECTQRSRWLARVVIQRWTQRVWLKRTQCNVDMIDMQAIPDKEAILLTDTVRRVIYRFHSRDVFSNLIANIGMSEEMLPNPRYPTNPWTNEPLRPAQTISICEQLVRIYAKKGKCPPVLFAAFCEARFHLKTFYDKNSSLLAQHAITTFFKDLHQHNYPMVTDTIIVLLTHAGLDYSIVSIRKWLRQAIQTPLHKEWLNMVRDYTLYINLRIPIRASWITLESIHHDVRELYSRTTLPSATSRRLNLLTSTEQVDSIPPQPPMFGLLGLPMMLQSTTEDIITEDILMNLLHQSFGDLLAPPSE